MGRGQSIALLWVVLGLCGTVAVAESQAPAPTGPADGFREGDRNPTSPPAAFKNPKHDAPFLDSELARGTRNIAAAWFSDPTPRYRHTPFGNELHPTTLTVSTTEHRVLRLQLPK